MIKLNAIKLLAAMISQQIKNLCLNHKRRRLNEIKEIGNDFNLILSSLLHNSNI